MREGEAQLRANLGRGQRQLRRHWRAWELLELNGEVGQVAGGEVELVECSEGSGEALYRRGARRPSWRRRGRVAGTADACPHA